MGEGKGTQRTMNFLKIRAVKFKEQYGIDKENPWAVQFSQSGLEWWTMGTYPDKESAVKAAQDLEAAVKRNFLLNPALIIWQTKI